MSDMYRNGQTIRARGRDWIIVCAPEGDTDMLIADPCFTEEESARIQRVDRVNEAKRTVVPHNIFLTRSSIDLNEIMH